MTTGFTVQIAQAVGAGEDKSARNIMKQGLIIALCISVILALIAALISSPLPRWLGGEAAIQKMASQYFLVYMLGLPALQMNSIAGGMHQSSGNMRLPGILNVMCCVMDVIFNLFFIFPTRIVNLSIPFLSSVRLAGSQMAGTVQAEAFGSHLSTLVQSETSMNGLTFTMPGLGLGVAGAALGTITAEAVTCAIMVTALLWKNKNLHLRKGEHLRFHRDILVKAVKIGVPVGLEQMVMCSAYARFRASFTAAATSCFPWAAASRRRRSASSFACWTVSRAACSARLTACMASFAIRSTSPMAKCLSFLKDMGFRGKTIDLLYRIPK